VIVVDAITDRDVETHTYFVEKISLRISDDGHNRQRAKAAA